MEAALPISCGDLQEFDADCHRSDGRQRPILVDPHRKLEVQSPIQRLIRRDLFLTAQKVIKRTSTKAPQLTASNLALLATRRPIVTSRKKLLSIRYLTGK